MTPDPDTDERFAVLMERLPSEWSEVPAEESGEAVAFGFIRAAYGDGYVAALELSERA